MSRSAAATKFHQVRLLVEEVDEIARGLPGLDRKAFEAAEFRTPRLTPPELGFERVVSWLYVLYEERGRATISFLLDYARRASKPGVREARKHIREVSHLRTLRQHSLRVTRKADAKLLSSCKAWYREACSTADPRTAKEWSLCLNRLLLSALGLLKLIRDCAKAIEVDEAEEMIARQWYARLGSQRSRYDFDDVISEALHDCGMEGIDAVAFRDRYYEVWVEELASIDAEPDFGVEARRLVEHSLCNEAREILPITGRDLMDELGIEPGQGLMHALLRAQALHSSGLRAKPELLEQLRQWISQRERPRTPETLADARK